jgi:hypothetical protein
VKSSRFRRRLCGTEQSGLEFVREVLETILRGSGILPESHTSSYVVACACAGAMKLRRRAKRRGAVESGKTDCCCS